MVDMQANGVARDSKLFRQRRLRPCACLPQGKDLGPLGIGQAATGIPFSAQLAFLRHHIIHVVLMGTRKEVPRVDAQGLITPMQDKYTVLRPLSRCDKPACHVGTHIARLMRGCSEVPIPPLSMRRAFPWPTVTPWAMPRRFVHLGPKAISKGVNRCASGRVIARQAAVNFGTPRGNRKGFAAGSIGTGGSEVVHQMTSLYGRDDVWTRPPRHKETRSFPADQAT